MVKHAILSASGSEKWLNCPPSARLEEQTAEERSIYAEEGTFAHLLAEIHLKNYLNILNNAEYNKKLQKLKENEFYSQEMEDYLDTYIEIVVEKINEAKARSKDTIVFLEQKLDFSPWVPEGFGTGDVVIISDGIVEVVDFKYGKGVPVSAEGNTQMRLYGLGALNLFDVLYDINTIRMTIVQPRLDNVSSEKLAAEELLTWGNTFVKPRAEQAFKGEGKFTAGDHCRFCRAKATCRARAEANLELARYDFQDPALLSNDEIAEILFKAEELKAWAADIQAYALDQAFKHGVKFEGWKLVEGRSNRRYTDEEEVAKILIEKGYNEDDIYKKSILNITAMEKLLGKRKFNAILNDLVVKPAGKPTLVPETDKRPELSSVAAAIEDFKNN